MLVHSQLKLLLLPSAQFVIEAQLVMLEDSLERMKCIVVAAQKYSATTSNRGILDCLVCRSLVVVLVAAFVRFVPLSFFFYYRSSLWQRPIKSSFLRKNYCILLHDFATTHLPVQSFKALAKIAPATYGNIHLQLQQMNVNQNTCT